MSAAFPAPTFQHWIAGSPRASASGKTLVDCNPLDDSHFANVALGSVDDISAAVETADSCFNQSRRISVAERKAWLLSSAEQLERNAAEFVDILIDEIGSPILKAQKEIETSVRFLKASAAATSKLSATPLESSVPGRHSIAIRQPLGVVAAITPFNVPLIKTVKQSAMALATGNSVVMLPSEDAPVISLRMAQLYSEAGVPDGTLNVVTGRGAEIGDALTTHPMVRAISFTGSSRVGRHIGELCGRLGKRFTLEMGGKNPLVVLKDADVGKAVEASVFGSFLYQGQICMASSRIYVERPCDDEFLQKFVGAAAVLGMGDLRDPRTMIGPIINERQRARVRAHLEDAIAKGAEVRTGGAWINNRCRPTILTGVTEDMVLYREETFGPVTSVCVVDSPEEALAKANDSSYGLCASVFTSDQDMAMRFAQELHVGMVHVNGATIQEEPHVPFGGVGDSGFGREGTVAGIDELTEWKWITTQGVD